MIKKEKNKNLETKSLNVPMDKVIPKFCTTINISVLNSKNFVLSMLYKESEQSVGLIDRIVIDLEHAKSLKGVLDNLIKEVDDVSTK